MTFDKVKILRIREIRALSGGGRLPFIDINKGILILLCVLSHEIDIIDSRQYFVVSSIYDKIEYLWVSFFMPSFFFVSGFCSSMNKSFKSTLWQGLKTLILPTITLTFLCSLLYNLFTNGLILNELMSSLKRLGTSIVLLSGNWFIQAMFLCRLIYWIINNISEKWLHRIVLSVTLSVIGSILSINKVDDFSLGLINTMIITSFFCFGQYYKNKGINIQTQKISILVFLILYFVFLLLFEKRPVLVRDAVITYWNIIPMLLLGVTGSIAFISICTQIGSNKFLEYFGRNSLVVYILHIPILGVLLTINRAIFSIDKLAIVLVITTYLLTLLLITVMIQLLNKTKLKVLLGRF